MTEFSTAKNSQASLGIVSVFHVSKLEQSSGRGLPHSRWLHEGEHSAPLSPEAQGSYSQLTFQVGTKETCPAKIFLIKTFSPFELSSFLKASGIWRRNNSHIFTRPFKRQRSSQSLTSRFDVRTHNLFPAHRAVDPELCCPRTTQLEGKEGNFPPLSYYSDEFCYRPLNEGV